MDKIRTHRDLKVWRKGIEAAMSIYDAAQKFPDHERFNLTNQILRSSRSVPANISEAWRKRRYSAAFVSKLNDSEGEAAETQTHIELARRCGYLTDDQAKALECSYEEIISMLVTMANHPDKWCL